MTTLFKESFRCAFCNKLFKDYILGSTNTLGGMDTELRTYALGIQPLPSSTHSCQFCVFIDFTHDIKLSTEEKRKIGEYLKSYCLQRKPESFSSSEKYKIYANILKLRKMPSLSIANAYLNAAWTADDENNELSKEYRKEAIYFFIKALKNNEVICEEAAVVMYLIGELNRRLKNFSEAIEWFSKVTTEYEWLKKLCKRQKELALKKNSELSKISKKILRKM